MTSEESFETSIYDDRNSLVRRTLSILLGLKAGIQ